MPGAAMYSSTASVLICLVSKDEPNASDKFPYGVSNVYLTLPNTIGLQDFKDFQITLWLSTPRRCDGFERRTAQMLDYGL